MGLTKSDKKIGVKIKDIFSQLPGKFIVVDKKLSVVSVSKEYAHSSQLAEEFLIGKNIFNIAPYSLTTSHVDLSLLVFESLHKVLKTGESYSFDTEYFELVNNQYFTKELEKRYWNIANSPILNDAGEPEYIIHTLTDNTEKVLLQQELIRKNEQISAEKRKHEQVSEALRASNKRLKLITDMIPAMIGYVGNDHRYKFVNKSYLKYFQIEPEDIIGERVEKFLTIFNLGHVIDKIEDALEGNKQKFDLKVDTHEGKTRHFEVSYIPDIDSHGKILGFVSMIMDTTDKAKYYEGLSKLIDARETLLLQKDEFIEMASHELKTPLTTIKAYVQMMLSDIDNLDKKLIETYLGKTHNQINQLKRLISALFDASSTKTGRLSYNFESFKIKDLIHQSMASFSNASKHKIECQGFESSVVYGDREKLGQVMESLLSNAIKYSPDQDHILVTIEEEDACVKIAVKDSGIGIPEEEIPNIFKRFSRAHALSFHNSGLGLGLYLAKEIIDTHHGKIWAKSTVGKGSVFYIQLPKATVATHAG